MGGSDEGLSLEFTPTWVVAAVCTVIVAISLAVERLLHYGGKYLKSKNQKPLFEALQKVKEELMLLGFISLLLAVFQRFISKICVSRDLMTHMLPCSLSEFAKEGESSSSSNHKMENFQSSVAVSSSSDVIFGTARRLLSESSASTDSCTAKGKVPLLSTEALHHLHIFIFVLAIVHVTFCVCTVIIGGIRIQQWKHWEESIAKEDYDSEKALGLVLVLFSGLITIITCLCSSSNAVLRKVTHVHEHDFIKDRFRGIDKHTTLHGWMKSFVKQFHASVTKADYVTLRLGFITTHCKSNPKFNFHKYMLRALEDDFRKVVGISWYLWIFVIIFLLLNVNGWHTYFWIAFIPFILLLAVGTKLEHVITQLAHEVAEKHIAIEGDLVVQPSDEHFWFSKPRLVLYLIHFILFQNAFEIAFFFWILVQFGFDSCIMGRTRYIIPRLIVGVFIQVLCSYSTLPLYAIVTQMGTSFKKVIFDEHIQAGLVGWAMKAKKKKGQRRAAAGDHGAASATQSTVQIREINRRSASGEIQSISTTSDETGDRQNR